VKSKRCIREWFAAELSGSILTPRRGCTRVVAEVAEQISEKSTRESWRTLTANIGDRLLLFGASVDQIQSVEIRSIRRDYSFVVSRGYGGVNDGAVHVLRAGRAA
jgi:hypothetical protein